MSKPRTILFLHPSAELYGADRTLLQLVSGLDRARWRSVVLLPRRGLLAGELEAAGALVETGELGVGERASLTPRGLLRLAWRAPLGALCVWRLTRRYRPSLIHTNTMIVLGGAIGARISGVPHLWHVHEILENPAWLARLYARVFHLLADRVIFNSWATRNSFEPRFPELAAKSDVVLNGVDQARLVTGEEREELRRSIGVEPDQTLVLLAGRINAWKGQTLLVRAASRLRERYPDARYLLAGDVPPDQPHFGRQLDELITEHDLVETVVRIPFHSGVEDLYGACDICCVPSTRPEPFGLVAAEAMRAGRPVVASDHGGLAEIVVSGVTGTLFPPGDESALAAALAELFDDPERAQEMGHRGRGRQRNRFRVERYCNEFDGQFQTIARDERPPSLVAETRIVHLVLGKANPERPNGVNRAVHFLACAQVAAGRQVEVWGLTPTPRAPTSERPYTLRLFGRTRLRGRLPKDLQAAIRELPRSTVVHLHGGLLPEMASAARRLAGADVPFVFTPHGAYNPGALAKRPLLKRLCMALVDRVVLRRARAVQAFTPSEAHAIARWIPLERIAVVPNGQDLEPLAEVGRATGSSLRFGFCGRLDAHTKGLDLLLDGFALFLAHGGRGKLVLIGDGPDRALLAERAGRPDLRGRVELTGALFGAAKTRRLSELDAFVHPSRHEGMPMAVLEAAALGLPLLVSEGTNLAPAVKRAGAGPELIDCDAEGVARGLGLLAAAGRPQLDAWGRCARRMIAQEFAWERVELHAARNLYDIAPPARQQTGTLPPALPRAQSTPPHPSQAA